VDLLLLPVADAVVQTKSWTNNAGNKGERLSSQREEISSAKHRESKVPSYPRAEFYTTKQQATVGETVGEPLVKIQQTGGPSSKSVFDPFFK
jgi:hypothetical protein